MITNWLSTVPYSQRLMLLIVTAGLIWAGFYAMVWQPVTNEIEMLTVKVHHVQQEIEREKAYAAELSELEIKLRNGMSRRPVQAAIVSLGLEPFRPRKDVMDIASDYKLPLTFWQPGEIDKSHETGIETLSIHGRLEGGYHQIAKCLTRILQLPWAVEVSQLRLRGSNDVNRGGHLLTVDFQLVGLIPSGAREFFTIIDN